MEKERVLVFWKRSMRTLLFSSRTPLCLMGLGLAWVREVVHQRWAPLGPAHARLTMWSADHGWAPVGPNFLCSTGRAIDLIIIVGPPALLAYMAVN